MLNHHTGCSVVFFLHNIRKNNARYFVTDVDITEGLGGQGGSEWVWVGLDGFKLGLFTCTSAHSSNGRREGVRGRGEKRGGRDAREIKLLFWELGLKC